MANLFNKIDNIIHNNNDSQEKFLDNQELIHDLRVILNDLTSETTASNKTNIIKIDPLRNSIK